MELCKTNTNKKAVHIRSLLRDRLWFGYIKWKDFKGIHMLSLLAKWPISLLIALHQNHFVCVQHTELYQKTWVEGKTTWPSAIVLVIAKHRTGFEITTQIPKHHVATCRYHCIFTKITLGVFLTGFFLWQFKGHFSAYVSLRSKAEPFLWSHDSLNPQYCDVQNGGMRSIQESLGVTNAEKSTHYAGNELHMHLWVLCWEW